MSKYINHLDRHLAAKQCRLGYVLYKRSQGWPALGLSLMFYCSALCHKIQRFFFKKSTLEASIWDTILKMYNNNKYNCM